MAEIVRMPKMSDTMTEGVVAKWHKKVGDEVKSGDLVADIETDKATMEFESYQSGTLLYRGVEEGKAAPVDGILAILGKKGENYKALLKEEESKAKEDKEDKKEKAAEKKEDRQEAPVAAKPAANGRESAAPEKKPAPKAEPVSAPAPGDDRVKASPLARRLARDKGIDLSRLMGTGDAGRVVKRDIDWFKPGNVGAGAYAREEKEGHEDLPVSQMRKAIARRLTESKFTAPHFYLTMEINMDRCVDARESVNRVQEEKISFNDFVIKAAAAALRQHPQVNASWQGDVIRRYHHVHVGVAVGVEEGLLVPVVRFADQKTLSEIAREVKAFSQKARDKKLQPADWEGNTFTVSNLGMYGI
jgi:pyruvate dehydrogenase E2 component (dihydrolipoamide acetyltransferase)